jgi:hypothetical protein
MTCSFVFIIEFKLSGYTFNIEKDNFKISAVK